MEIDLLKSASQDQMDMIMMMQMGKLSALCGPNNHTPTMDFSGGISNGNGGSTTPEFISNHLASRSFINPPSNISFWSGSDGGGGGVGSESQEPASWRGASEFGGADTSQSEKRSSVATMREMIFRIAAMQPIHIDPETVKPPKRRNVKISMDPQSVAARHRRERISERIRILQRLVPGGTKMDTASMLDEAIHYVKFLKTQVQSLELAAANRPAGIGFPVAMSDGSFLPLGKANYQPDQNLFQQYYDA